MDNEFQKQIIARQTDAVKKWLSADKPKIEKFGKLDLIILPKVFSPKTDSILLASKMKIRKGNIVIDTCAGSGIQTIYAVLKGASMVYSCDINLFAVENIKLNVKKYNFENKIKVFKTDLFPKLDIKADVIIANPPYTDNIAKNITEKSVWDKDHRTLKILFKRIPNYLNEDGRVYISWANFADFELFEKLLKQYKFVFKIIAKQKSKSDRRIEYRIYELSFN